MGLTRWDTPRNPLSNTSSCSTFAGNMAPVGPSSCSTPQGRSRGPRPTCSTRLIHWKLSSSEASDAAPPPARSGHHGAPSPNTAILGEEGKPMTTHDRVQTLHPMRHKLWWGLERHGPQNVKGTKPPPMWKNEFPFTKRMPGPGHREKARLTLLKKEISP